MSKASLIVGNGNWAIKDSSLLGYNINDSNIYSPFPFDVTRASAATRVDKDGLIVTDTEILSEELITNGDFSNGSADWSFTNIGGSKGWRIANNRAICDTIGVANGRNLNSTTSLVSGKTYKVTLDIIQSEDGIGILIGSTFINNAFPIGTNLGASYIIDSSQHSGGVFSLYGGSSDSQEIDNISVVEVNQKNLARIDYTDSDEGVLLTEPQSTNFIPYSEDFSNSSWLKGNSSVVGGFSSPSADNPLGAFKLIPNTNNSVHKLKMALSTIVSGIYTYSVFCKKGEYKNILVWDDALSGGIGVNLDDLSIFRDENNQGYKLEDYGDGWIRISVVLSYSSQLRGPSLYIYNDDLDITFQGDGASGLYVFGAQLEQQSYVTSYIPTFSSISTRNNDIVNNGGEVSTFNSEEGVLFAEIAALSDDLTNRSIRLSDGTSSNYIVIRFNNGGSNRIYTRVNVGSSPFYFHLDSSHNITDTNKIAIRYKDSDFATFINGVKVSSQTSGSLFPIDTLNDLSFYGAASNSETFYGKTSQIQVFKKALSDSELQILTTI